MLAAMPQAYWDAMAMQLFPSRTLEELDGIDWPRLMRALQVRTMEHVEKNYPKFFEGKWEPEPSEWLMIFHHNRLMKRVENGL